MKKLMFLMLPVSIFLTLASCEKDKVEIGDRLVLEIAASTSKVNVEPSSLPQAILNQIEEEYFETYIETAAYVEDRGFEVMMGNEDALYFREDNVRIEGAESLRRLGPCGRGFVVRPSNLPDEIKNYVATNYPDAEILRAKRFKRAYVVMISGRRLLIFDTDLQFVKETVVFHFCSDISVSDVPILPVVIAGYIETHYPDATVVKAGRLKDHIVVGILTPDGRKILVFDRDGNFLFERD